MSWSSRAWARIGFELPARPPMIIVPLIAVPLAVVIWKISVARLLFVPLLAASLVFSVAAIRNYGLLYPSDNQRIFGVRSTAPAFPVLNGLQLPQAFTVTPGSAHGPQTGRFERDAIVARAGRDGRGYLLFGPYASLKSGISYQATFSLAAEGVRPDQPVAVIEAGGAPDIAFARKIVTAGQLEPGRFTHVDVLFTNPGTHLIETRVFWLGKGTLRAGPIQIQAIGDPDPPTRFRDWPLAFLWVAGTILIGWLFVEVMRARNGRRRSDA